MRAWGRPDGGEEGELQRIAADVRLLGKARRFEMTLPARPARPRHLLPLFREVTDAGVEASKRREEGQGNSVSCVAGCGACCRQLVPIAHAEAHVIRDLVEDLPPKERRAVERRFADARARLREAGLLAQLEAVDALQELSDEAYLELAKRYFAVGIPCPFLVDESCSIHSERPLICREYNATTPAAGCTDLGPHIKTVPLVSDFSLSLEEMDGAKRAWVPLALAIEWANANADLAEPESATTLMKRFLERVVANKLL